MFITLEGVDGTGKSTQARLLAQKLTQDGHQVLLTREPGGTPGAEEIRALILGGKDVSKWSDYTEILLFNAARRDHIEKVVLPFLRKGGIVICDRYVDTTYAYQGMKGAEYLDRAKMLHEMMIGLEPDLTLLLDMPAEKIEARLTARPDEHNRMEEKGKGFRRQAMQGYRDLMAWRPQMHLIDADADPEVIAGNIAETVSAALSAASVEVRI